MKLPPRRTLLAVALLALLAAAALGWRWRPPAVPALAVQAQPLQQSLLFSARVATPSRVELGATLTGRVAQVLVDEGATVATGAPLVRLEDAEARAALVQAQAGERQAAARLAGLRGSGRSGVAAGVAQAESVLRAAEAEAQRTQELVARGFLSPARQDESQRALAVARAQLSAAQAQAAAVAEQGSEITQAQAALAVAEAGTQAARARLEQTLLRAPAAGRVLQRAVEPGQIVQPGRALLTLALAGPLELEATVDERYLQQLRPGQSARVRADAFAGQPFKAQVSRIAPLVDAQRGAVQVHLTVAEAPDFLREDMSLSVEVATASRERALVLPLAALRGEAAAGGDGTGPVPVWVLAEGRVAARSVRLGLRTLQAAEVLSGLQAGELVLLGPAPAPGSRARADLAAGEAQALRPAAGATSSDAASLSNAAGR